MHMCTICSCMTRWVHSHLPNIHLVWFDYIFSTWCYIHRDEPTQLASLNICQGMLGRLKQEHMSELLPLLRAFGRHISQKCRLIMYDILIWIYNNIWWIPAIYTALLIGRVLRKHSDFIVPVLLMNLWRPSQVMCENNSCMAWPMMQRRSGSLNYIWKKHVSY